MRKLWPLMVLVVTSACLSDTSPNTTTTGSLVSAIALSPNASSIAVGQTVQLNAALTGGSATTIVTWTSSNPLVAAVSATGLTTAKGTGTATITATSGAVSGATIITVLPAGITITPTTSTLAVGQSVQLRADVNDGTGSASPVTWSFSDALVASVSASGLLTAKGTGVGAVTATTTGTSTTASIAVTPASITVTPAISSLVAGQVQTFTAVVNDGSGKASGVNWSFSNNLVGTVIAQAGILTTIAPGTGTLTATAAGLSKDIAFTVTAGTVNRIEVCDLAAYDACIQNGTVNIGGEAVAARATAKNLYNADISSSCVFQWTPLIGGTLNIQLSTDAMHRDALITRVASGEVSVVVTCGNISSVFTVH